MIMSQQNQNSPAERLLKDREIMVWPAPDGYAIRVNKIIEILRHEEYPKFNYPLDKAIQSYNRVIKKNPDNNNNNNNTTTQLLYNKALFLLNSGARNKIEALKCYDKIIEINPKNAMAWIKKGSIQEWPEGAKGLKTIRYIEINPKNEKVYRFRLINPNYVSRAYIKYYDKAIEINNSNYENNAVDIWLYLCYTLAYRSDLCGIEDWEKRLEKALYCINKALECKSKYAENLYVWRGKASLLSCLGRDEEAAKTYDKAFEYGDIIKLDGTVLDEIVNQWW
jgi:tetratricopeptide (TPR) repeat protein